MYTACILMESRLASTTIKPTIEEIVVLIDADDEKQAIASATQIGLKGEQEYEGATGNTVQLKFIGAPTSGGFLTRNLSMEPNCILAYSHLSVEGYSYVLMIQMRK